jgi:hypothetical protein
MSPKKKVFKFPFAKKIQAADMSVLTEMFGKHPLALKNSVKDVIRLLEEKDYVDDERRLFPLNDLANICRVVTGRGIRTVGDSGPHNRPRPRTLAAVVLAICEIYRHLPTFPETLRKITAEKMSSLRAQVQKPLSAQVNAIQSVINLISGSAMPKVSVFLPIDPHLKAELSGDIFGASFDTIGFDKFPGQYSFSLQTELRGGPARARAVAKVVGDCVLPQACFIEESVFTDPSSVCRQIFNFDKVMFLWGGHCQLQLWINDALVESRPIRAIRRGGHLN